MVCQYHTGACEKSTPPEKNTLWRIGSQSTESGAGEQFLLNNLQGDSSHERSVSFPGTGEPVNKNIHPTNQESGIPGL